MENISFKSYPQNHKVGIIKNGIEIAQIRVEREIDTNGVKGCSCNVHDLEKDTVVNITPIPSINAAKAFAEFYYVAVPLTK